MKTLLEKISLAVVCKEVDRREESLKERKKLRLEEALQCNLFEG